MSASRTYITAISSPPTAWGVDFTFSVQDNDFLRPGTAYVFTPRATGPDPDDPYTRVEVQISSVVSNVVTAQVVWSLTATPRELKARDFIQMARDTVGLVPVMTVAGIQAAHDQLAAAGGGRLVLDEDSPVPPSATALHLYGNDVEIEWPTSSPLQLTPGLGRYTAASIGNNITQLTRTWLTAPAAYDARYIDVTSLTGADDIPGPSFARGDYIIIGYAGTATLNRIANISALQLELERPVATPIPVTGVAGTTGIVRLITGVTENLRIKGMRFDNNGNTNPGVSATYTPTATTQLTADATPASAVLQVASSAAFTIGQYVVVDYNGTVQGGESKGFVRAIVDITDGTHITLAGPVLNTIASGALVEQFAAGDLAINAFAVSRYTSHCKFEDIAGDTILGSVWDDWYAWENSYKDVASYQSGFQYQTQWGFALQFIIHTGSRFVNVRSEAGLGRGIYTSLLFQCHGDFTATRCNSRGIQLDTCRQSHLYCSSSHNIATGTILSQVALDNEVYVSAHNNTQQGFIFESSGAADASMDNHVVVFARGNGTADAQGTASDLRNRVDVINYDAVINDATPNKAFRKRVDSYSPQAPVDIASSAAETVLVQFTVAQDTMFANSHFVVEIPHFIFNNKGTNGTVTYRIYTNAGATKVFEGVTPNIPSAAGGNYAATLRFIWGNANSLSAQRGGGHVTIAAASDVATGIGAFATGPLMNSPIAIAARTDPSSTQDFVFKVTAQLSAADANFTLNTLTPTVVFVP